ncbi:MAG: CpaF family protein [Gammaproteobacteria bacterium]|nr:CpaF family protein [Gammaproteobacteria bacterium]
MNTTEASSEYTAQTEAPPAGITISAKEREMFQILHQKLIKMMDLSVLSSMKSDEARRKIRQIAEGIVAEEQMPLNLAARQRLVKQVADEILGLGPLEPLLADPTISDILVNSSNTVYVERNGRLHLTDVTFQDDAHLLHIIDRIVSSVGRRIDESSPMVDARLKDGSRVNAIIRPLALDGPMLSIRRFAVNPLKMEDLIKYGTVQPAVAQLLTAIVKARLNMIISGGTGAGKTTLLNVLSGYIPEGERLITIEDSAELQFQHDHLVRLETRPPNVEGKGQVAQRDLVRNALRMRPDRIIIGEVRGAESLDMLQAMNTGHDGSLTTIHANSPRDALTRVENMVSMTGFEMPLASVRSQIASAVHVVLQLERLDDGTRKLVSVQEINGMEGDIVTMSEIFAYKRSGVASDGKVIGSFQATGIVPVFYDRLRRRGIDISREIFDPRHETEERIAYG